MIAYSPAEARTAHKCSTRSSLFERLKVDLSSLCRRQSQRVSFNFIILYDYSIATNNTVLLTSSSSTTLSRRPLIVYMTIDLTTKDLLTYSDRVLDNRPDFLMPVNAL